MPTTTISKGAVDCQDERSFNDALHKLAHCEKNKEVQGVWPGLYLSRGFFRPQQTAQCQSAMELVKEYVEKCAASALSKPK